MIIDFKYGFECEGFLYGWHKKELYRLPQKVGSKYGIKKLNLIPIGNHTGYRIKRKKFTVSQCVEMTSVIEKAIKIHQDKNIPLIPSI
jgi:hypothetical protein